MMELKERIKLFTKQFKENEIGELDEGFLDKGEVWANLQPIMGSGQANQKGGDIIKRKYRVRIRYRPSNFDHMEWNKKKFSLLSGIYADINRTFLEFLVGEV